MKRIIASVLAASTLAVAGVAAAQSLDDRIDRIENRIDRAVDDHRISEDQALRLRGELASVRNTRDDLDSNGQLSDWRRRDLESRLDHIAYRVSRDVYFNRYGTYRGYRYGWNDDDDGY
jgi:septal ring factor EnvC (AmiA/AmiB activator)